MADKFIKRYDEAMQYLANHRHDLTRQQVRTLRGQILAGDTAGAMRGLKKLMATREERKC